MKKPKSYYGEHDWILLVSLPLGIVLVGLLSMVF
jgi:hypothetical protein